MNILTKYTFNDPNYGSKDKMKERLTKICSVDTTNPPGCMREIYGELRESRKK